MEHLAPASLPVPSNGWLKTQEGWGRSLTSTLLPLGFHIALVWTNVPTECFFSSGGKPMENLTWRRHCAKPLSQEEWLWGSSDRCCIRETLWGGPPLFSRISLYWRKRMWGWRDAGTVILGVSEGFADNLLHLIKASGNFIYSWPVSWGTFPWITSCTLCQTT